MAREAGLDLVEVAPQAKPPVCRIMDYGKHKYAVKKKERKSRAQRHETELKMVRIRTPRIGTHDLAIKVAHARDFLERGDRVQFTMWFRGREMVHTELGRQVLNRVKEMLEDLAKVERDFRMEGRNLSMVLAPIARAPQKPAGAAKPKAAAKGAPKDKPAAPPQAEPAPAPPPAETPPPPPSGPVSGAPPAETPPPAETAPPTP